MAQKPAKIRLYVKDRLQPGAQIETSREQAHYLGNVMRCRPGDHVLLFNGLDGEWEAAISALGKRSATLELLATTRPQTEPPDLWLCFAPVKKARTDFIAEKACEMGCRRLLPVLTRYTNSERVRTDRLAALGVEAAEQCGILSVPEVADPVSLERLLDAWPLNRRLMFCDESGDAGPATSELAAAGPGPWAVLIGPEGGFAPEERDRLRVLDMAVPVSLGPRILRADTAAVAALSVWQAVLGDW